MTQTESALTRTEAVVAPQLRRVVEENSLEPVTARQLFETFQPHFEAAETIRAEAARVNVTDATQLTEMKQARALRLKLRDVRVAAEKDRKRLKEDSLRTGKAIDGINNIIKFLIEPEEERLEHAERFAERAEAARKAQVRANRDELLRPFGIDTTHYALGDMTEAAFAELLESTRLAHEARLEAARKAEEARIAKEKADAEERARIAAENERLKREAQEREAAAKAERERIEAERQAEAAKAREEREALEAKHRAEQQAAEAAARAEREAREKLEREAKARAAAEAAKAAEQAKAKRAAERAPDADKLRALAAAVRGLPIPSVKSEEARAIATQIAGGIERMAAWIEAKIAELA